MISIITGILVGVLSFLAGFIIGILVVTMSSSDERGDGHE